MSALLLFFAGQLEHDLEHALLMFMCTIALYSSRGARGDQYESVVALTVTQF